jgi:hypothetical protein
MLLWSVSYSFFVRFGVLFEFLYDFCLTFPAVPIDLCARVKDSYLIADIDSCLNFVSSKYPELYTGTSHSDNCLFTLILKAVFNSSCANEF